MKQAEQTLNMISYDRNNKNIPIDKFIGKLKQAFIDLNRDVPEALKIRKLGDSVNVPSLGNIFSIVKASPECRASFDRTVVHCQGHLTSLGTKYTGKRSISLVEKKETDKDNNDKDQPWNK
jgi:hypothetical protein